MTTDERDDAVQAPSPFPPPLPPAPVRRIGWWARIRTQRRLSRGRCRSCDQVLRDDQRGFCSLDCSGQWQTDQAL